MMSVEDKTVERKFEFSFNACILGEKYKLEVPIHIPFKGIIGELAQRLISAFQLPIYFEEELLPALETFINIETQKYYDDEADKVVEQAQSGQVDLEETVKQLEKAFREETVEYAEPHGATDEELFATVYHKLVHSPVLDALLLREHMYSVDVATMLNQRDEEIVSLSERQQEEMQRMVSALEVNSTEAEINALAARQCEDQNLIQAKSNSQMDSLRETQRREYRQWLMRLFEDQATTGSPLTHSPSHRAESEILSVESETESPTESHGDVGPVLQESFTIHLGSQMKQMHNIRILSADVLHFCRARSVSGNLDPERLQTALGLYSNDLCGLVLLTDGLISTFTGITKDFINVCQGSTEFHFPSVEDQLEKIRQSVKDSVPWQHSRWNDGNRSLNQSQNRGTISANSLRSGDVYVTRHSNLAEVHVVFHMVVDDTLRSGDINSRHPAILGLRNVLKTACSNDITTLTVPLLLSHTISEEMTVLWCAKRAELVLKCVKGFMIEMASWGGSELKNLQFLVPRGISEDLFASLAALLPSVFRVSNPLVFKASSAPITPKTA